MTQSDKELLLKDLCARLPYGVKYKDARGYKMTLDIWSPEFHTALNTILYDGKPSLYLRPMSSMTEEELKEFVSFTSQSMRRFICEATNTDHWFNNYEEEDWLNAHHFDHRGLIEKRLALKAPDGMYNKQNN